MEKTTTILIADDELIGREAIKALLHDQGYNLAFANDGLEALTCAIQLTPDVILLDVMMPNMDGFEVCRRLRANAFLSEVPIIMLTALEDRESRLQAISVGADDFISKPYDSLELKSRLRTITKLNRYRRLLTEQAKFEWVVEQAEEGFLILSHKEQILYANSQARLYLDLTTDKNEFINKKFSQLLAAKQYYCEPQEAWATWLSCTNQGNPCYLVRPETPTAHAFWLQVDLMEMSSGAEEKYLVCLRNVTNTILAERRRWTFQGQICHKLKTPLTPLTVGLEYLKSNYSQLTDTDRKEFIDIALVGATRIQAEIEEILEYLSVSYMAKVEQTLYDLDDILLTITEVSTTLEIESVHVFQKNIEEPSNIYISIFPRALEIIFTELFSNAKKFHPKGSPTLEINISTRESEICLQICDDGLTLSPEQLSNIWTPYYQGEKYISGEVQGMGLGLSIVTSLIWEVGGKCRAYNREEKTGFVVELILPLAK